MMTSLSLLYVLCSIFLGKIPVFLTLDKLVRNKKSGISCLYLLLCGFFFLLSFSFPSPQQIRNWEFRFYIRFFTASSFWLFLLFFKFHSSNSSIFCQLQLPSPQLHLTCMLFYHIHVGETIYTALPRDDA